MTSASFQSGSDLEITANLNAAFQCDGKFICIDFYRDGQKVGRHFVLASREAVEVGMRIAQTGLPEDFPISAGPNSVRVFGNKLREYGESCTVSAA